MAKQFQFLDDVSPKRQPNPNGFNSLRISSRVTNQALGTSEFVLAAAQVDNRVVGYYFINNVGPRYDTGLSDFAQSLHVAGVQSASAVSAQTAPPASTPESYQGAPGFPQGVPSGASQPPAFGSQPSYSQTVPDGAHSSTASQPTLPLGPQAPLPSGAMEGVYVSYLISGGHFGRGYLIFNPDGWVVRGMPEGGMSEKGMEGFDFTAYRNSPTNKMFVGRYRLDRNDINIIWQDYAEDRQLITRDESGTSPALGTYVPTCRCTGKRFSGVYVWGPATSQQYLQFLLDGTFVDNQLMDKLSGPYYFNPRLGRDTYSIKDRTLTLNYSDGRIVKQIFLAPKAQENEQVFDWIELNNKAMFERQHQPSP